MTFRPSDSLRLISLTGYIDSRRDDTTNVDGTAIEILTTRNLGHIKSFSQELRLEGDSRELKWLVGGYYSNDRLSERLINYTYDATAGIQLRTIAPLLKVAPAVAAQILGVPPAAVPGFSALAAAATAPYSVRQLFEGFAASQFPLDGRAHSYAGFANGDLKLSGHPVADCRRPLYAQHPDECRLCGRLRRLCRRGQCVLRNGHHA